MNGDDDDRRQSQRSALGRWFSRSVDEIEQERRQAEQAGREAYEEAIRTGQNVLARTQNELIALGRSRLAQGAIQAAQRAAQTTSTLPNVVVQTDSVVRAAANTATGGLANNIAAGADALTSGAAGHDFLRQYNADLRQQRSRDRSDIQSRYLAHTMGNIAGDGLLFLGGAGAGAAWANRLSSAAKGNLGEDLSAIKSVFRGEWPAQAQARIDVPGGYSRADHVTLSDHIVESKFGPNARLTQRQRQAQALNASRYRVDRWTPDHVGNITGAAAAANWPFDNPDDGQ